MYEATVISANTFGIIGVLVSFDEGKEGFICAHHLKLKSKHRKMLQSGKVPFPLLPGSKLNVETIRSTADGKYHDLRQVSITKVSAAVTEATETEDNVASQNSRYNLRPRPKKV